MLAIAYFTGRVAVLPAALHFEKYYYLWEFIDVERSVPKVHFRESHFLSKARSHARRGVNAARVQVREDGTVSVSRVLDDDRDDLDAKVYSRPNELDPMALAVAAATRDDAVAILAASTGFGDHSVVEFLSAFSQFFSFAAWGYVAYRVARWFLATVAGVRRPPSAAEADERLGGG